jgi:hypothetical protein
VCAWPNAHQVPKQGRGAKKVLRFATGMTGHRESGKGARVPARSRWSLWAAFVCGWGGGWTPVDHGFTSSRPPPSLFKSMRPVFWFWPMSGGAVRFAGGCASERPKWHAGHGKSRSRTKKTFGGGFEQKKTRTRGGRNYRTEEQNSNGGTTRFQGPKYASGWAVCSILGGAYMSITPLVFCTRILMVRSCLISL